jgi:putative peptide-modifying radical SAM enzyme
MFFHLILTSECNLQCRYCYGGAVESIGAEFGFEVDYSLPQRLSYSLEDLKKFCEKDPECSIIFYGGEPLLCLEEMKMIMDKVKAKNFLIQTNGILLNKVPREYLTRLHTILLSIDGDEKLTDYYRGKGTWEKVIENIRLVKELGFGGEIIARMTVMEETDIYRQVRWLLENETFPFSSVHWQLNAGFWNDFGQREFIKWVLENYNPGIKKLVDYWVEKMEEGKVLKLYPFLGVTKSLLLSEKSKLRCGAGWANYAIQTDGHIVPCPCMWGMKEFYLGHISTAHPLRLREVKVEKPCTSCDIFESCGGRCLYANVVRAWDEGEYSWVCETVRNMIFCLQKNLPKIRELIKTGRIKLEDFDYMKFNGCEIIP